MTWLRRLWCKIRGHKTWFGHWCHRCKAPLSQWAKRQDTFAALEDLLPEDLNMDYWTELDADHERDLGVRDD